MSPDWRSHHILPDPVSSVKTQNFQEGRPARHLLSTHCESEGEIGLRKGEWLLHDPTTTPAWPGWADLDPQPVLSQERQRGRNRHQLRGETALTWESRAVGRRQPQPPGRQWQPYLSTGRKEAFENWEKKELGFAHPPAVLPSDPAVPSGTPSQTPASIIPVPAPTGPTLWLRAQHQTPLTRRHLSRICAFAPAVVCPECCPLLVSLTLTHLLFLQLRLL